MLQRPAKVGSGQRAVGFRSGSGTQLQKEVRGPPQQAHAELVLGEVVRATRCRVHNSMSNAAMQLVFSLV